MSSPNGTPVLEEDTRFGIIRPTSITSEMQEAYLDYAMSVIVSRALPDVRDGLKPVHRRILYAMYRDLHLTSDKPHKKSARIVGEVLGKYHPHGDSAVYDAMVRMAQPFSLRYPLVDGQGNFGSVDGDGAAAMRYTEARLSEISNLIVQDLDKDTVDWHENFDNSLREPDILPSALPNLLINGSNGIAVGMSTNIPPHNLNEIIDALAFLIDHFDNVDDITVEQLMHFVKGPDFPTGGILYRFRKNTKGDEDTDAISLGYATGRSRLILQAKAHFEEMSRNRSRIVVTELPYQTNKTTLIERIASLVRDGKIEGIVDLRDESDRTGMRIVVELTRNVQPKSILEALFKYTPLQQTFGMQMLSLVDGEPRTLPLKRMLQLFVQHRQVVVRRRSEYDLERARAREHILAGLLKALDILDEVIATIRKSQRVETARTNLMKNFGFTEIQAQAILDMQLRRLAALERKRLADEYDEVVKQITYLEDLLAHPEKMLAVIKEELLAIKEKYGDARRTQIVERTKGTLTSTDLLPDEQVWVTVGSSGNLHRQSMAEGSESLSTTTLRQIGRGSELGIFEANTRDLLYLFRKDGRVERLSIHELPQNGTNRHYADVTQFSRRDEVTAALALPRLDSSTAQGYLFCVTEQGAVKRVALADFASALPTDLSVMNVDAKDKLVQVLCTDGDQEVILVTARGQAIRFAEDSVRSMGLAAGGVGGMKVKKADRIVCAMVVDPDSQSDGEVMTITAQGYAKRTELAEYSVQGRNGSGITTHKPNTRTGDVVDALIVSPSENDAAPQLAIVVPSQGKVKPLSVADVPQMGRSVMGKTVVALDLGTTVAAVEQVTGRPQVTPPPLDGAAPNGTGTNGTGPQGKTASSSGAASNGRAKKSTATRSAKSTSSAKSASEPASTQSATKKPASSKAKSTSAETTTRGERATKSSTTAKPTSTKRRDAVKAAPAKKTPAKSAGKSASTTKATGAAKSTPRKAPAKQSATKSTAARKPASATGAASTRQTAPPKSRKVAAVASVPQSQADRAKGQGKAK